MKKQLIFSLLLLLCVIALKAQNTFMSQPATQAILMSPGETGQFRGLTRAIISHRQNWNGFYTTNNQTHYIAYDQKFLKQPKKPDWLGLGAVVVQNKTANNSFSITQVQLQGNYYRLLTEKIEASLGLALGFTQYSLDLSNEKWGNQYNGLGFDPGLPSNEADDRVNTIKPLLNTGLSISYTFSKEQKIWASWGLINLLPQRSNWLSTSQTLARGTNSFLFTMEKRLSVVSEIVPRLLIYKKSKQTSYLIGSSYRFSMNEKMVRNKNYFEGGLYLNSTKWLTATLGAKIDNLTLTGSIDIATNRLIKYTRFPMAFELSLLYAFRPRAMYNTAIF